MSELGIGKMRLTQEEWAVIAQFISWRGLRGLPQRAVDEKIGCSDYVEKCEAGIRAPSLRMLCHWAQALGLQIVLVPLPGGLKRMPPTRSGAGLTAADLHPRPST